MAGVAGVGVDNDGGWQGSGMVGVGGKLKAGLGYH